MNKAVALALAASLLACPARADDAPDPAAQQSAAEDSMMGMLSMKAGAEMSEADRGYVKSMQAMQQALIKTEMTGDASGDFARVMIRHHQSAIAMVDVLLAEKGVDPALHALAESMRAAQAKEIVEMQKWLDSHQR